MYITNYEENISINSLTTYKHEMHMRPGIYEGDVLPPVVDIMWLLHHKVHPVTLAIISPTSGKHIIYYESIFANTIYICLK